MITHFLWVENERLRFVGEPFFMHRRGNRWNGLWLYLLRRRRLFDRPIFILTQCEKACTETFVVLQGAARLTVYCPMLTLLNWTMLLLHP